VVYVRLLFIVLALLGTLLPGPALAEWRVAETKQFRVYSDGPEKTLREQVRLLERFDWLLRRLTGADKTRFMPPLDVYLVRSASSLHALAELPEDTAGVYSQSTAGTAVFMRRMRDGDNTGQQVLFHEFAHHFMVFHFPYAYPSWYVEGFADYVATADVKTDAMSIGLASRNHAEWLGYASWLDMKTVMTRDAWRMKGDARAMFYAQSWLATHYLLRDAERARQLDTYLKSVRDDVPLAEAFPGAFGIDFDTFGKRLNAYARGRSATYSKIEVKPGAIDEPDIVVRLLPASADRLLLPYAALRSGIARGREDALLADVRAAAAVSPGDAYASEVLAGIEAEFGDAVKARAMLAALLDQRQHGADLHYLIGRSHMRSAEDDTANAATHHAAARRHLARAFKARPDHYQTLFNYVLASGDPRQQTVLPVLERAHELAPQVGDINIYLAQAMVASGQFARAETLLQILTASPHRPPSPYVRALLQRARDRNSDLAGLVDIDMIEVDESP
jgi:hypothetical protein